MDQVQDGISLTSTPADDTAPILWVYGQREIWSSFMSVAEPDRIIWKFLCGALRKLLRQFLIPLFTPSTECVGVYVDPLPQAFGQIRRSKQFIAECNCLIK